MFGFLVTSIDLLWQVKDFVFDVCDCYIFVKGYSCSIVSRLCLFGDEFLLQERATDSSECVSSVETSFSNRVANVEQSAVLVLDVDVLISVWFVYCRLVDVGRFVGRGRVFERIKSCCDCW